MAYELEGRTIYPLSDLFSVGEFPLADLLPTETLAQIFDGLYYTEAQAHIIKGGAIFDIHLAFEGELALTPPGTQAVALVLGAGGGGWTVVQIRVVIGSDPSISIVDIPVTLRLAKEVLRTASDGPAEISMTASISLLADGSLVFDTEDSLSLPECEIAGSGITIRADNLTWNFNPGETLPEAIAAGINGEFIGIAFQQATLKLPQEIKDKNTKREIELSFDYCCIGTGGFTGGVQVAFAPELSCDVGGFTLALQRAAVRFQQSRLVMGEIEAVIRDLDFFDADVGVDLKLSAEGLRIALAAVPDRQDPAIASVKDGLLTLRKPGILSMTLTAAELTIDQSGGSLRLSGQITPEVTLPGGSSLPGFKVDALTITSSGQVSVEGGWIDLPSSTRIALGPFALELTRVGLGTEGTERWVAFSGALSLVQGVPITAAVDGLKIRWDPARPQDPPKVDLEGVALSFEIKDVLRLQGSLRFSGQEFRGSGTLQLISVNMTVSVQIVIGKRADYTYLYLYLLVQPPVGVPIFSTGLAFYSFEALYGRNMTPDRQPAERWYQDWYRRPPLGPTDQSKWIDQRDQQAFGAGVMLGTLADKGYSIAVKGLLILILPGPVILLDARANLLKDPSALALPTSQALFNSLVVYDGPRGTLELGIEPHYVYPDKGELVDVTGIAEAFYSFNDPRAWYVHLGQREREKRIRARLLSLFEANAYLMVDANSLELGGFIGYDGKWDVGPVHIFLQAYMEGAARVSWRPKQFYGNLHFQAGVGISVAGIGLSVSASATVEAQAPRPFYVTADVKVRADLPFPIPDLETTIPLHWEEPKPPNLTAPLQAVGVEHLQTSASWPLDPQSVTGPVVPLDSRLSLAFDRAVNDLAGVGANAQEVSSIAMGDYRLRFDLAAVEIDDFDATANTWRPYARTTSTGQPGQPRRLYGMWQVQPGDSGQGNRRLMLWVRSPFEWLRSQGEQSITQLEEAEAFDACEPTIETQVLDFDGTPNQRLTGFTPSLHRGLTLTPGMLGAAIVEIDRAVGQNPRSGTLPGPYYRCLLLPAQFGTTLAPGPGSSTGSTGGSSASSQPSSALRIDFPVALKGIAVLVVAAGKWSLEAFDGSGISLGVAQSPRPVQSVLTYRVSQLALRAANIRRVQIDCDYPVAVVALAIQGAPSAAETATRRIALQQALERFKGEEPIFEPHRSYRLRVTTQVVETQGKALDGAAVENPLGNPNPAVGGSSWTETYDFVFQTQGPPGDTTLSPLSAGGSAPAGLETLEPYVRQELPPRGSLAAYRNYDLGVAFIIDYMDQEFRSNGQQLSICLRSDQGETLNVSNSMGKGNEIVLRREERAWLYSLSRSTCQLSIQESDIVRESAVRAQLSAGPLLPRRRYDAVLCGMPAGSQEAQRPLYQWSFISSAYLNFADHFQLRGRVRSATVSGLTWAQWQAAIAPALTAGDPWAGGDTQRPKQLDVEIAAFEALFTKTGLERALPADLELHALTNGGSTWGILISSPEPFDWQRITFSLTWKLARPIPSLGRVRVPRPIPGSSQEIELTLQMNVRPLRDADGTRAILLLLKDGAVDPFPPGSYTLQGTFKRDGGGKIPTLSERGSTAAEQAELQWTLPAI